MPSAPGNAPSGLGGSVVLVIYDEVLYSGAGVVGRWGSGLARELAATGRATAPMGWRTNKTPSTLNRLGGGGAGNLKRRITATSRRVGPKEIEINFTSGAYYTMYVINGTATFYARNSLGQFRSAEPGEDGEQGGMFLPANGAFRAGWRQKRAGQSPNDFMSRTVRIVGGRHSSLSGYHRVR